jgi:hypothetical protein
MTYYIGNENTLSELLGQGQARYFYGLRRDDEGLLFFTKIDQLTDSDGVVTINVAGSNADNYEEFEYGVDYFDGRLELDHSRPYPNLYFDQYRWDTKNCFYYINGNGELVVRINKTYIYTPDQIV